VESGKGGQEEGKGNGGAEEDGKPEAIVGGWVFFLFLFAGAAERTTNFQGVC
jgi:hypothetical protein